MSMLGIAAAKATSLFFLTFLSEDAATLGGATLSATGLMATPVALAACALGIWIGDLGIYGLARYFGRPLLDQDWAKKRVSAAQLAKSEAWWKKRGVLVLLVVRFVPGLRLPTYLIAGALAVPFASFALVTGIMWGARSEVSFSLQVIALKALPVLILGGFTSIPGAIIGGLIIGIGEKIGEFYWGPLLGSGIESWLAYVIALIFLLFRPQGLFGEKIIERI